MTDERNDLVEKDMREAHIADIYEKVLSGKRLSREEGIRLYQVPNILALGKLADIPRRRLHGNFATYVYNQHINYSNVCVNQCRFCAFGKGADHPASFALSIDQIVESIRKRTAQEPLTEVHIVGSLHPDLPYSYYTGLLQAIHKDFPHLHIKAFTAVEIAHIAKTHNLSIEKVLQDLKSVGLQALPGGGAEIFSERVRREMCPTKLPGKDWLSIMKIAHKMGINSNATMLYGHIETIEERVDHMLSIREAQDETGGFLCFIPLAFHSANTPFDHLPPTSGIDDLKTMALARLMLDNVPHIKAYWVMLGIKLAQVALCFGADDLDGTILEEKITKMAGRTSPDSLSSKRLEKLIQEAGFIPRQRNTFFQHVDSLSSQSIDFKRGQA